MESPSTAAAKISTPEKEDPSPAPDPTPPACPIPVSCSPPGTSGSANPKAGKKNGLREHGPPLRNSVNRSISQIRRHVLRKSGSPVNWYPRKKGDSFLQRKIKHLQEVGGMNLSLDETLCGANLHYSRIAREKIAATQAANKAMEARKAAMVEASWCRILKAARIQKKEAEEELNKAEKNLSEALKAAVALGVMMYDKPDSQRYEVETSLCKGGQSTHTITASFETAFEVEKEVAAAVKKAFVRLANCNSLNKDEFKALLHKISENPDNDEVPILEFVEEPSNANADSQIADSQLSDISPLDQRAWNSKRKSSRAFSELVDMMFDRIQCLNEDELSSLTTIVATCGLNAALSENCKHQQEAQSGSNGTFDFSLAPDRRMSTFSLKNRRYSIQGLMQGCLRKGGSGPHQVGLDQYLVKHQSRLEKEVHEARNQKKTNSDMETSNALESSKQEAQIPALESKFANHVSGLEENIETKSNLTASLDSLSESDLVSSYTKEITEKCPNEMNGNVGENGPKGSLDKEVPEGCLDMAEPDKENIHIDLNVDFTESMSKPPIVPRKEGKGRLDDANGQTNSRKYMSRIERAKKEVSELFSVQDEELGLDKILIKPKLDTMKPRVEDKSWDPVPKKERQRHELEAVMLQDSLDKVLVRHVSRLEKEKLEAALEANKGRNTVLDRRGQEFEKKEASLDEVLVKRWSRLEKGKLELPVQQPEEKILHSSTHRAAREKELQEAWGGLSLGNSLKPSLSRLEREKAAWKKAEEEEKRRVMEI